MGLQSLRNWSIIKVNQFILLPVNRKNSSWSLRNVVVVVVEKKLTVRQVELTWSESIRSLH